MIYGDAVGLQRNRLFDCFAPTLPRFAYHAGDEVDVYLPEVQRLYPRCNAINLFGEVCPAVFGEDFIVQVFHAEAEAGYADRPNRLQLRLCEGAGFTLKRDFLCVIPREHRFHPRYQRLQVLDADIGRRAAAEIDEFQRAICDCRLRAVELHLFRQRVQVNVNLRTVLIGVNPKIAELAPLAAKGDVHIQSERCIWMRRRIQRLPHGGYILVTPSRIRRIVGDENAPYRRLFGFYACRCRFGFCLVSRIPGHFLFPPKQ